MVLTTALGLPRIGPRRELKTALESHWAGRITAGDLEDVAKAVRADLYARAASAGLGELPVGDFALYDHVLDAALTFGAVPERFGPLAGGSKLDLAFAMARGGRTGGREASALEMTKWFDTNYHYLVPELSAATHFRFSWTRHRALWQEARSAGHEPRPVIIGPLTFLQLAKPAGPSGTTLPLLDRLLPAYEALLADLAQAGVRTVQLDEPVLVLDPGSELLDALERAYARVRAAAPGVRLWLAPYFGSLGGDTIQPVLKLPVDVLHLDLVRGPEQIETVVPHLPAGLSASLGLVDGRNVWITDLERAIVIAERAAEALGPERLAIATSCSLLHVPYTVEGEDDLDPELRSWLAFAQEKLVEVTVIGRALDGGREAVAEALEANREALDIRRASPRVRDAAVRERMAVLTPEMARRSSPYPARREAQKQALALPPIPATTIGSFPQTKDVRAARAAHRRGELDARGYEDFLREETAKAVRQQEELGLDVLVHGEFERNDMVEYFGERLSGIAFTRHGWVQSYGSRCVKPPIIFGDVARPAPMTVAWARYAQSLTDRPMKGMLTGPITIQQWSFVRDDQPRADTCRQIALAIRDEVRDLEEAGIPIIQIDEPALREGMPLKRQAWEGYLAWAGECFRLASSGVADGTQIHTHMCYSEFNDIIEAIAALDADVISIEAARSRMELLDAFATFSYPNEIGPGVYDIHSPRIPEVAEMEALLARAAERIPPERLWANPDCGLKTRAWDETLPALAHLVQAVRRVRTRLSL